jgi:general L-amino acid transport system permease protein
MTSVNPTPNEVLAPPTERSSVLRWLRDNLFSSWSNTLLTIVSLLLIYFVLSTFLNWAFNVAQWEVIPANLRLFMIGQYPISQAWRIWLAVHLIMALAGFSWAVYVRKISNWIGLALLVIPALFAVLDFSLQARLNLVGMTLAGFLGWSLGRWKPPLMRRVAFNAWIWIFPLIIVLVRGLFRDSPILTVVPSNFWGGLLLTFLLTVVGIVFSFPLGILLALGRRSELAAVRWFSIGYIEVVRGVPLITILFMAQFMLPLFLPGGMTVDRVLRAMVGITLFSAAYLAENVRGGLQAIPHGQYEAAHALGLSGFNTMRLIILPQALRAVIPILVGQFISLFKDTSLVAIVGLFDLLGIADSVLAQPAYIGRQLEVYLFISLIYFIFSYGMSFVSQRLEKNLGVGER